MLRNQHNKESMRRVTALLLVLALIWTLCTLDSQAVYAAAKKPALSPKSLSLTIGEAKTIKVKNAPKGAKRTYKSSKKSIASVTKRGKVKGLKAGTAKITVVVTTGRTKKKLTRKVTVKKPELSKNSVTLEKGKSAMLSIKNKPHKNAKAKYQWTSADKRTAAVKNGTITAVAPGATTISVKVKIGKTTSYLLKAKVIVKDPEPDKNGNDPDANTPPTGIQLNKETMNLNVGETQGLTATVLPEKARDATVTWNSFDQKIATVESGQVRGQGMGTTVVEAKTVNGKTARCVVNVGMKAAESFDDFAKAAAELTKTDDFGGSGSNAQDPYGTKRLLVKGDPTKINLTQVSPTAALKGTDGIYVLQFSSRENAVRAEKLLKADASISWVEPDGCANQPDADENRTEVESYNDASCHSWGVARIGADQYARAFLGTDRKVTVAMVDTGVSSHPFLVGRIAADGYDFVENDREPSDPDGHGTHGAGIIVDCASNLPVNILPIRVLGEKGGTDLNVGNGIRYAVDHGAAVINLGLSGAHSQYKEAAIKYAISKGAVVVVSAGNDNEDTAERCPAHRQDVIVAAATDQNDEKASFSNYGWSIDIAAPGVDVTSCVPGGGFARKSGTSAAAAHVSALAAMLKLDNPALSPAQIEQIIKDNAESPSGGEPDIYYGYGIPDMGDFKSVPQTGIALSKTSAAIGEGETLRLTATVLPVNATNKTVIWHSSDPSVATVKDGLITGVYEGTATITARTVNGKTADCEITVNAPSYIPVETVTLSKTELTIAEKESADLTADILPKRATDKTVTWSSSNASVAAVKDGVITGVTEGTAAITARAADGKSATCQVTVKNPIIDVRYISIDQKELTLAKKESGTLSVTISPENATDKTIYWNSEDQSIATVDQNGIVTAVNGGVTTVTATAANGVKATVKVFVLVEINTPQQLKNMASDLTAHYKLMRDIDLGNTEWTPIGADEDNAFTGDFDGNGHKISGLKITNPSTDYSGLFGSLKGNVKNLTVEGQIAFSTTNASRHVYTGGICGDCEQGSSIIRCDNRVSLQVELKNEDRGSNTYVGGIVGYGFYGEIKNCRNYANISASSPSGLLTSAYAGGILGGGFDNVVENCENVGGISAYSAGGIAKYSVDSYAGGIAGAAYKVRGCTNKGTVRAEGYADFQTAYDSRVCAGGIAGFLNNGTLEDCVNLSKEITAMGNEHMKIYKGELIGQNAQY